MNIISFFKVAPHLPHPHPNSVLNRLSDTKSAIEIKKVDQKRLATMQRSAGIAPEVTLRIHCMLAMERASEGIYPDIESLDMLHYKSKTGVLANPQFFFEFFEHQSWTSMIQYLLATGHFFHMLSVWYFFSSSKMFIFWDFDLQMC